VERSSLFQILFSSQGRCVSPTKSFTLGTGYGCFTYIPLFWTEDSRVIDPKEFDQLRGHYYTRPGPRLSLSLSQLSSSRTLLDRAYVVGNVGIVVGALSLLVGCFLYVREFYKRKAFQAKIYID
jgi:hypothetical protein